MMTAVCFAVLFGPVVSIPMSIYGVPSTTIMEYQPIGYDKNCHFVSSRIVDIERSSPKKKSTRF